jgi:transcription elongation factor Elf1
MFGFLFKPRKQNTYCYCPNCNQELVSSNSFVSDNHGIVTYNCCNCKTTSKWDFCLAPVPLLIKEAV